MSVEKSGTLINKAIKKYDEYVEECFLNADFDEDDELP